MCTNVCGGFGGDVIAAAAEPIDIRLPAPSWMLNALTKRASADDSDSDWPNDKAALISPLKLSSVRARQTKEAKEGVQR